MDRSCSRHEINSYKILVRKPEGKRPPGRPRCRCENNIRMNLREMGWEGADWMNLARDRDGGQAPVTMVMKLCISQRTGKFLTR
jgi:hypothetical protein